LKDKCIESRKTVSQKQTPTRFNPFNGCRVILTGFVVNRYSGLKQRNNLSLKTLNAELNSKMRLLPIKSFLKTNFIKRKSNHPGEE